MSINKLINNAVISLLKRHNIVTSRAQMSAEEQLEKTSVRNKYDSREIYDSNKRVWQKSIQIFQ